MSELSVPYLSEHEAPNEGMNKPPGYNPPKEEKDAVALVDKLYSRAKRYRKRYDQKWVDFYKMFRGRQWKEVRPSYRHSEVINLVFQTIESMVPVMTDSRPKLEFLATVPNDPAQAELSDILNKIAENDWIHNNWLMVLTEILFDSHFYGTGFGYVGFDDKANLGLGNICFESWDPFYCFPDPNARDINDKRCKYFVYAEPKTVADLKKEYPDKAQYITADVIDLAQGDKSDINQVMFKSPVDSKLIVEGSSAYDGIQRDQALKITCYFKDDSFEEEEDLVKDEDGTPSMDSDGTPQIKYVQKLKYPNGRKIVTAGSVLLEDVPFEFEDGQIPGIKLVNYILPREFWGMGEVEQLEGPQKTINKLISFSLDVLTLMGNPIWKVGTGAGVDTDNMTNQPGLIIECDDVNQVQREPGVELQPFVLQMIDRYKSWIDGISGETDLSRGAEPNEVSAASAISELQEAQQTRLRLKSRNMDSFLQQFGKMYISRVSQFYSVPRIVRVSGDENAAQFFHFHVELFDNHPATGEPFMDESGQPTQKRFAHITNYDSGMPQTKTVEMTSDFDVRVTTGSSLPFAKKEKAEMSFNLFKMGVIDDEELLKNLDYPNYEAVLQRMNMKRQMMAQQQAQMQAQGGPPPGAGGPPPPQAA